MDYQKVIDIGSKVSLAVVLMLILYTGSTGYWVFGSQYKDIQNDRDTWKELALKGTKLADQAASKVAVIRFPSSPTTRAPLPPLPSDPTPQQVSERLDTVSSKFQYKSEPTDKPLP